MLMRLFFFLLALAGAGVFTLCIFLFGVAVGAAA